MRRQPGIGSPVRKNSDVWLLDGGGEGDHGNAREPVTGVAI